MAEKRERKTNWKPTPAQVDLIEEWTANGVTAEEIGGALGIDRSTLFLALKQYPDLADACARARLRANANVTGVAFQMAASGKDQRATEFWLRCRAGWLTETERRNAETNAKRAETDARRADIQQQAVEQGPPGLVIIPLDDGSE